jgi:hypothetical protein
MCPAARHLTEESRVSALASFDSLSRRERLGLWLLLLGVALFGMLTVWRAALMNTRKGDQEIYFWSAYAVRTGHNLYEVEDSHGWHYIYPPLFAILIAPLAERPPGHPVAQWTLPFPVSVGLWYALSVALLCLGVHALASAVEAASRERQRPEPETARWWALRLVPVLVCLPAIGHTLMRGQVNLLVLALLAGMAAATLRGRPWRAGLCLGAAICIKVIPAFLVLFPLWRRDLRCLAGCALGLALGLAAVPLAVLGPEQTVISYRDFVRTTILPGLGHDGDQSRANEVMAMNATHSQSFVAAIHSTLHLGDRPPVAARGVRLAHWLIAALLTVLTLWAAGRATPPAETLLLFGCLTLLMILTSPVCHMHHFALAVPLVMGLLAVLWENEATPRLEAEWKWLLGLFLLVHALLYLPIFAKPRDLGIGLYPSLLLLAASLRLLYRRREQPLASRERQRLEEANSGR